MSLEDGNQQIMRQNSWSNPNHLACPVLLRTYVNSESLHAGKLFEQQNQGL